MSTPLKRPAPSDSDVSPGPPNKGVKFQDGLSPGEGKEGETIIPGVDRHATKQQDVKQKGEAAKRSNAFERAVWTFIMIGGFICERAIGSCAGARSGLGLISVVCAVLLCAGAPAMILLVMLCQTLVYKEVTALFALYARESAAGPAVLSLDTLLISARSLSVLTAGGGEPNAASSASGASAGGEGWNKTLNWYFFVVTNYFLYGESIIYYFKVSLTPKATRGPNIAARLSVSLRPHPSTSSLSTRTSCRLRAITASSASCCTSLASWRLSPTCSVSIFASSLPCFAGCT